MSSSESKETSRVYIPKAAQAPFLSLVRAFRKGGASALPPEARSLVERAFAGGNSIESGIVTLALLLLEQQMVEHHAAPDAGGADGAEAGGAAAEESQ